MAPVPFGFPVAAVTIPAFSNHLPEFQGSHPYIQQEYQCPGAPGDPEITAADAGILLSCAPPTTAGVPLGWGAGSCLNFPWSFWGSGVLGWAPIPAAGTQPKHAAQGGHLLHIFKPEVAPEINTKGDSFAA